jgi:flagellar FliL protein
MAAVIADPAAAGGAVPVKRGKKKLLIMVAAALAVVLVLGAGTIVYLKKRAAHAAAAEVDEDGPTANSTAANAEAAAHDALTPPTYLPLDPFVVNLADKETDRYAQVGITLEVDSSVVADQMRAYMPSIRNAILMVITRKTSRELLDAMGKEQLADEIAREAVRPMGIDIAAPQPVTLAPEAIPASGLPMVASDAAAPAKRVSLRGLTRNPIRHVHFSSFIIQ